jgi:hypothetical protein
MVQARITVISLLVVLALGRAAADCDIAPRTAFGTPQNCKFPSKIGETCAISCSR